MTDTPTPPAMTQEQRAELVKSTKMNAAMINLGEAIQWGSETILMEQCANQLEADGVTIATLTAECDAAQTDLGIIIMSLPHGQNMRINGPVIGVKMLRKKYDAAQAEIARLAKINVKLCADFNLMNQHGAKQDAEIARLTAALAAAREDGMREAMQCCQAVANEAKSYNIPQMTMGANTCRDAILDAIKKGAAT